MKISEPMKLRVLFMCGLCSLLLAGNTALGWGPEGHRAVAIIATRNLTPEASAAVKALLDSTDTLTTISVWADDVRDERPETAPWHYVNIPLGASGVVMKRDCRRRSCVIAKVEEFESMLKDKSAGPARRQEALKFLVHFVADLHQPLHCEDNHDSGGNRVPVIFFGELSNLHAVWDTGLLHREKLWGARFANDLDRRITAAERTAWSRGSLADWALESHALAARVAYAQLPHQTNPNIGEDYTRAALPVVEEQLEKAGIRLAYLLNKALP